MRASALRNGVRAPRSLQRQIARSPVSHSSRNSAGPTTRLTPNAGSKARSRPVSSVQESVCLMQSRRVGATRALFRPARWSRWSRSLAHLPAHQLLLTGKNGMDRPDCAPSLTCTNGLERVAEDDSGAIPKPCAEVRILPGAPTNEQVRRSSSRARRPLVRDESAKVRGSTRGIHPVRDRVEIVAEQVAVPLECQHRGRVAEHCPHALHGGAGAHPFDELEAVAACLVEYLVVRHGSMVACGCDAVEGETSLSVLPSQDSSPQRLSQLVIRRSPLRLRRCRSGTCSRRGSTACRPTGESS